MIIGICGLIGSGKNTVANHLIKKYGYKKLSFADSLKDVVSVLFGWDRDLLEGDTDVSRAWRQLPDGFWSKEMAQEITPRYVLQKIGTECMRDGFYQDIWVALLKQKIFKAPKTNYVISDVRYINEMKMIQSFKEDFRSEIWEVKRENPDWFKEYLKSNIEPTFVHRSEWDWIKGPIDHILLNNHDFDFLEKQVDRYINNL